MLVLCVVGVALLHFMTRSFYLRVVRDQAAGAQPSPPLQLRQWPPDLEAQPPAEQPAVPQRPPVLVVQPDSEVHVYCPPWNVFQIYKEGLRLNCCEHSVPIV